MPPGEKKYLNLRNMLTIEIQVDKWYSKKTVIMKDKVAIHILQDYLNSLDLIEVENDYRRNNMGHMYMMFLPYDSISIKGEYLSVHPEGTDDKVYTEYYIVDSGYNPITGGSNISDFIDDLINMYTE